MKTLYTLLLVTMLSLPAISQSYDELSWTPIREQEQDDDIVVGFIPSLGFSPSSLLGTVGLAAEAQLYRRVAVAPEIQYDLFGRYYTYGFYCTAYVITTRTSKIGFGYQLMQLNIIQDRNHALPEDGINLHLIYLDARARVNDNWDLRIKSGVSWNNIQMSFGLVYRFLEDSKTDPNARAEQMR